MPFNWEVSRIENKNERHFQLEKRKKNDSTDNFFGIFRQLRQMHVLLRTFHISMTFKCVWIFHENVREGNSTVTQSHAKDDRAPSFGTDRFILSLPATIKIDLNSKKKIRACSKHLLNWKRPRFRWSTILGAIIKRQSTEIKNAIQTKTMGKKTRVHHTKEQPFRSYNKIIKLVQL